MTFFTPPLHPACPCTPSTPAGRMVAIMDTKGLARYSNTGRDMHIMTDDYIAVMPNHNDYCRQLDIVQWHRG